MDLRITKNGEALLEISESGEVLIPMDEEERVQCRKALQDALQFLSQTVVTRSTFSTATETDAAWKQTSPHQMSFFSQSPKTSPSKVSILRCFFSQAVITRK